MFSLCLSSRTASLYLLLQQVCMFLLYPWLGKFHLFFSVPCVHVYVLCGSQLSAPFPGGLPCVLYETCKVSSGSTDTFSVKQLGYILVQTLFFTRLFTSAILPDRVKTICSFSQQLCVLCMIYEVVTNQRQCLGFYLRLRNGACLGSVRVTIRFPPFFLWCGGGVGGAPSS